jgi:hydroxymethylglutaryl-CoA synthase
MNIGIDKISFYVPPFYLDIEDLANARGVDPNKFKIGIGQDEMSVPPVTQDIITFATNAANAILTPEDKELIDTVIIGSESGVDESKAAAIVVHGLLDIQPFARSFDIKQACYGATAGLVLAKSYIKENPERKVLVIASDIAKYGLGSGGEVTQGAGAVAMLISANPRILTLNNDSVTLTEDIYDFWRPFADKYPTVDGHLSNEVYIGSFSKVWDEYNKRTGLNFNDFAAMSFHTPYTKMGKKAILPKLEEYAPEELERIMQKYDEGIKYSRRIGNLYTGSLYLSLISLLENANDLKAGDRIGLFSYGSGTVSEFFSGELVEGYQKALLKDKHSELLASRKRLSIDEYEEMFTEELIEEKTYDDASNFSITKLSQKIRSYKK